MFVQNEYGLIGEVRFDADGSFAEMNANENVYENGKSRHENCGVRK